MERSTRLSRRWQVIGLFLLGLVAFLSLSVSSSSVSIGSSVVASSDRGIDVHHLPVVRARQSAPLAVGVRITPTMALTLLLLIAFTVSILLVNEERPGSLLVVAGTRSRAPPFVS